MIYFIFNLNSFSFYFIVFRHARVAHTSAWLYLKKPICWTNSRVDMCSSAAVHKRWKFNVIRLNSIPSHLILNLDEYSSAVCSHDVVVVVVNLIELTAAGGEQRPVGGWCGVGIRALLDESSFVPSPSAFVHTQCKSPDPIGTRKLNHCRPC